MKVTKSNLVYDLGIELYMVPKLLHYEIPTAYDSREQEKKKKKLFGIAPQTKFSYTRLVVNLKKLKTKSYSVKTIKLRCICCDKNIKSYNNKSKYYDDKEIDVLDEGLNNGVDIIERRFVNINKRSAIFYIPVHPACKAVVELNPLAYLPKLEEIASKFDNENFRFE